MRRLAIGGAALLLGAMFGGARPIASLAAEPIANLPFAVATDGLFDEADNDGRQGEAGRWEVLRGQLGADALRLTVRIVPPAHGLPVQSGPAVLFGGLHLFGDAGGDMATGETVDSLTAVTLAPCLDAACQYVAEIALPIHDAPAAIKRLEANGELMWVSAEFTLVRTFARGTWLQVLPFSPDDNAPLDADAGRLGSVKPVHGQLFHFGLFPADQATPIPDQPGAPARDLDYGKEVEQRRRDAGDVTEPLPTTAAVLHVVIRPACDGPHELTMHDESGARILWEPLLGRETIERPFALPVNTPWWLTLHDGGGIDFDQGRQGWGVRVGPVQSIGDPLTVEADFDCSLPRGMVRITGDPGMTTAAPIIAGRQVPDDELPAVVVPGLAGAAIGMLLLLWLARSRRRGAP